MLTPEDICPICGADWNVTYTETCPVCMEGVESEDDDDADA